MGPVKQGANGMGAIPTTGRKVLGVDPALKAGIRLIR
jgi:hypothetical protein